MLRNSKDETILLFSSKDPDSFFCEQTDDLFLLKDSAMGLAGRGRSRRGVPRESAGSLRLQYYAKRTEPHIFIASCRARIKD